MINILCVCGNGMGTSTILKINIKKICDKHGIDASVESCAFGEALSYLPRRRSGDHPSSDCKGRYNIFLLSHIRRLFLPPRRQICSCPPY